MFLRNFRRLDNEVTLVIKAKIYMFKFRVDDMYVVREETHAGKLVG